MMLSTRFYVLFSVLLISLSLINTTHASSLNQILNDDQASMPASSSLNPIAIDDNTDDDAFLAVAEEEFLPVEEAYKLSVEQTQSGLSLDWLIADKYFLYGEQFQVSINNQIIEANLPTGIIQYDPIFEKDVEKHYHHAKVTIDQGQLPSNPGYELAVTSQGCADAGLCYPPHTQRFTINANDVSPIIELARADFSNNSALQTTEAPSASLTHVLYMIGIALIGGIILNLMPCVLPVLSLKALSLANSQHNHRHQGWAYTLGIISAFIIIAGLLLAVRAAGQAAGWGFQLQSPGFVTVLIYLFFVMGLSLSGFINIGTRWMNAGQSLTEGNGLQQSYFTGVLAAVVASPCTAPFMAPALGFAITQPWWIALSIFAGLGLGMAAPLLLLSYLPHLSRWLPKPGAWMETFKQALAFPLYLTAIWLLWVLSRQLGTDAAIVVILGFLAIVFIFWLGGKVQTIQSSASLLCLALAAMMTWHNSQQSPLETTASKNTETEKWEHYTPERLTELRQSGKAVFINMTADWCITCKVNEKVVFTDDMLNTMKDREIHLIKGDWTNYDADITQLLEKYKRGGVPLYVLFPEGENSKEQLLPQILTRGSFKDKINEI